MIWVANFILIFCTILLGAKRLLYQQIGWGINAAGNFIWVVISLHRHLYDYIPLPLVLAFLALYNFIKVNRRRKATACGQLKESHSWQHSQS